MRSCGWGAMGSIQRRWQPFFVLSLLPFTQGLSLTPVPETNLDLSSLGEIALAGDFDAISLYEYEQQDSSNNGSISVIASLGDSVFDDIAAADAAITTMCPFVMEDGTLSGVVVGGNFTSLGGVDAQAVALVDPNTTEVTPLPGIQGTVSALLCDQETNSVYVGGSFKAANSTNAIAWVGTSGWANLAFAGFNAPVTSITKAPSGHIVFGGSFTGLGNTTTPTRKDGQVINLSTANITSGSTTTTSGFNDPTNIVCNLNGTDGTASTWLLEDDTAGYWQANMSFGYIPTLLRLWNTDQDGRGTKTFRVTALPLNGIMNFTYTDPDTGEDAYCDSTCPLAHNSSNPSQDFHFVNSVGMNAFRIDISDWYGSGGGLDGIELFEDDIYAYAIDDFNEPSCSGESFTSNATATGPWTVTPSGDSDSEYLTTYVDSSNATSASVVFQPDIKQAGNYSVTMFTPGCLQTDSCSSRGIVNVTGTYASTGTEANEATSVTLYQTNDYDKYDVIFSGYTDAASDSFRPTVTLTPVAGSGTQVVASRVRFQLLNSTGGLNGLYEYNPNEAVVSTDFSTSAINRAGTELNDGAVVNALVTIGDTIYAGGKFSDDIFENIMAFSDNQSQSLPNSGLNAPVSSLYSFDNLLYVGGNFTNTSTSSVDGLNNIAAYSPSEDKWIALGQGVNGQVNAVVPLKINVTSSTPEVTISFSGDFTEILAFDDNDTVDASGFAIWVPSQKNWLQNIDGAESAFSGQLTAYANISGSSPLLAGSLDSEGMAASGAVSLTGSSSGQSLSELPITISASDTSSSLSKRASTSSSDVNGVVTGTYYSNGGRNVTVLAGHFSATATNGSTIYNILFLNGSNNDAVTGFADGPNSNSTIYSLAVHTDTLFVGGSITGTVSGSDINGLILYDLLRARFVTTQPPSLSGDNVVVNAISVRPSSTQIFVGGDFSSAGSLGCSTVCMFDTSSGQWSNPGTGIGGVATAFTWASDRTLIVGGNLTVNGNDTAVASYDAKKQTWSSSTSLSSVPGPVTAMTPGTDDASVLWISGTATNGSTYLININDDKLRAVGDVFGSSTDIRGLQVFEVSENHKSTDFLQDGQVLLVTGQLDLPDFGNASAALFNGTTFEPFVLTSTSDGGAGSLSQLISSKTASLKGSGGGHSKGIVILVSLCAALGVLFLIILIGFIIDRVQRRRQGYSAIPASYTDKQSNLGRVPPEHLFQNLGRNGAGQAPHV